MTHPQPGMINAAHGYRSIPRRVECRLLNRNGKELAFIEDAHWTALSKQEQGSVVNCQNETRKWILPIVQLPDGLKPTTGYQIRVLEDGTLWEFQSVSRPSDHSYHCVSVHMNEHDEQIP